ncbi:hypothetical protein MOUN0_L10286 [Monosporozyma unispora]
MELHSPRPEHIQLGNGIIIPKDNHLSHIIPGSPLHDPLSNGSLTTPRGLGLLLPPLPLEQRSMDHIVENPVMTNNHKSDKHPGFPSPPQSPRQLNHEHNHELSKEDSINKFILKSGDSQNVLLAQPVWNEGLNTIKYENLTKGFISKYRIFKDKDLNSYSSSKIKEYRHSLRNNTHSDGDSSYYSPILSRKRFTSPNASRHTPKHHIHYNKNPRATQKTHHRPTVYSQHHTTPNIKWELLPDFSPNWDTLPTFNTNKSLKVEWKGSTMDLSQDPLKDKLHPAELNLAQILRLPCDLYLDSKRRLFMAKVDRLKHGLPFRRTDAQKACHIDVNKASRLYSAFEKVGWLDDTLFTQYL